MAALLDAETIAGLREDGDELLIDLIEIFLREAPERVKMLEDALAANHAPQAERMAHTLKSSAAAFGAEAMRSVAQAMESAAQVNDLDQVRSLIGVLKKEVASTEEALHAELAMLTG